MPLVLSAVLSSLTRVMYVSACSVAPLTAPSSARDAYLLFAWCFRFMHTAKPINPSLTLTLSLQLMIVGSLTTDGNLWGSRSALNVIGVYVGQLCFNAASRYITKDWGEDVLVNLVALLVFAVVAGLVLIVQIRSHAQIWAEALQSGNVTDAKTIRFDPCARSLLHGTVSSLFACCRRSCKCTASTAVQGLCRIIGILGEDTCIMNEMNKLACC